MGADMLMAMCIAPRKSTTKFVDIRDLEDTELRRKLEVRARETPDSDILNALDIGGLTDEALADYKTDHLITDDMPGYSVNDLNSAVNVWLAQWYRNRIWDRFVDLIHCSPREIAIIYVGKRWWWATGGLSWGDTPTDAFDIIHEWGCLDPILKKPL
jgi:hypothetical protein